MFAATKTTHSYQDKIQKHRYKRVLLNPPTSDQSTTGHLLTDRPTNRPTDHRPTDQIITDPTDKILFQGLDH